MQARPRLAMASEAEHEAVIRELTRGHELTAQLQAEALRGQGQAEATAAFILQEVSHAFTLCLSIMSSPARAPPATPPPPEMLGPSAAVGGRQNRDGNIPREQKMTSSPHIDGYQWRKYGQKRITKTHFPRCYYRCSFHRERNCRATKQVQQHSDGDGEPPQYFVMYFNEHTCDTATWEPEAANPLLDLSGLARQGARALLDERRVQEEHERQVLVSSLACVLGGQQSPAGSGTSAVAANVAQTSAVVDAPGEMPRLDVDVEGLDVMDYDETGVLCFGDSYGLPDDGLPF